MSEPGHRPRPVFALCAVSALLLLTVAVSTACGRGQAAPAAACATGSTIEVDVAAWQQALEATPGWPLDDWDQAALAQAPDYRSLLAELGLEPLPGPAAAGDAPKRGVMTLVSVETADLRPGGGSAADRLIAARFRNAAGAESLRAAVLRPLPGKAGVYCSLGGSLSHDRASGEEPCLETHPGRARSLDVEPLVAADRDAVVVRDAGGSCGPGARRGDRYVTSFWGVEDGRLVRYFGGVTAESWYVSPQPPASERRGEIELSDSWPRTLTFTETVECWTAGDDCTPLERTTTYRYAAGRYLAAQEAAAGDSGQAEETEP